MASSSSSSSALPQYQALIQAGRNLLSQGGLNNKCAAKQKFADASKLDPYNPEAYRLLAQTNEDLRQYSVAASHYDYLIDRLQEATPENYLKAAANHHKAGYNTDAEQRIISGLSLNPKSATLHLLAAKVNWTISQHLPASFAPAFERIQKAEESINNALVYDRQNREALLLKQKIAERKEQIQQLAQPSPSPSFSTSSSSNSAPSQSPSMSFSDLLIARNSYETLIREGRALLAQNEINSMCAAKEKFLEATRLSPRPEARKLLADTHVALHEYREAAQEFDVLIYRLNDAAYQNYISAAENYFRAGSYQDAYNRASDALQRYPTSPYLHLLAAKSMWAFFEQFPGYLNNALAAEQHVERSLQLLPTNEEARQLKGKILETKEEIARTRLVPPPPLSTPAALESSYSSQSASFSQSNNSVLELPFRALERAQSNGFAPLSPLSSFQL